MCVNVVFLPGMDANTDRLRPVGKHEPAVCSFTDVISHDCSRVLKFKSFAPFTSPSPAVIGAGNVR